MDAMRGRSKGAHSGTGAFAMFHHTFRILRPRHPLARLLSGLLAVVVVLALLAVGTFALAALAIGGLVLALVSAFRSARHKPAQAASTSSAAPPPPGVIEGEFTIVHEPAAARGPSTDASHRPA
jgi:hypothetical protein